MKANEAIDYWIRYAQKHRMKPHGKHFWNARDIIEGNHFHFSKEKMEKTYEFIESLHDSEQKNIILEALKKQMEVKVDN